MSGYTALTVVYLGLICCSSIAADDQVLNVFVGKSCSRLQMRIVALGSRRLLLKELKIAFHL